MTISVKMSKAVMICHRRYYPRHQVSACSFETIVCPTYSFMTASGIASGVVVRLASHGLGEDGCKSERCNSANTSVDDNPMLAW